MPTRYGPEHGMKTWPYPPTLPGFLAAIRADPTDDHDTRMRVEVFMMTPIAKRMPTALRQELEVAGFLAPDPRRRSR